MREAIKNAVRRAGLGPAALRVKRALEPEAITRDRRDHEALRTVLAAVLAPDANGVDVGAHAGDVLADMVRLAPQGHHIAFEPLPALHAALGRRFPQADVRATALGREPGPASFVHVVTRPGWSGFRERPYPEDETVEHLTVDVVRLDDALPEGYVPAVIKIDVEGAELEVLAGAQRVLREHRPVLVFEHGLGSADHYGAEPEALHELLTGAGYRIFDLDGGGPYSREAFGETFHAAARVNFLARP